MNIFIYEWVCGGGFLGRADTPPDSLKREGAAMLSAVVGDFAKLSGVSVSTIVDSAYPNPGSLLAECHRAESEHDRNRLFDQLSLQADRTILIAPEFEGILLRLSKQVVDAGGQLLSPCPEFIEIASDKQATAERLHAAGVPVPRGTVLMPGERCPSGFGYPAILKPINGCGSIGVQLVEEGAAAPHESGAYRLEQHIAGKSVSMAFLSGGSNIFALEPCTQQLASGTDFSYNGGELPLPSSHRLRAIQLATSAVEAMPATMGYLGVDLVLGEAEDGTQDAVIEINPRYTTSYVGLRAATDTNLAATCLAMADNASPQMPRFDRAVRWDSMGSTEFL